MLGIKIICVGKLKEKYFIEAAEEYIKRLPPVQTGNRGNP